MAFNYRPKVDKKEDELKKQALAKMPTLKPVSKTTPVVKETKPTVASPFDKDFKPVIPTFAPAEALAKKFLSSATLGLTDVIKTPYTQTVEEKAKTMPVASTVANVAGYLSPGTAGAKLVKPLLKNVGSKLGKQALEGAIVGTGITAAENVVPLLKGEKDIQQVGKDIGTGLVTGAALDVGLYGLGRLAKPLVNKIRQGIALSQAEKQAVAQTLNVPVDSVDETVRKLTIQEELGLPKDMTAQQYQDKLQADAYVQSLKKSPQQIVDDFTSWRSKNFGGATGKMPPQDIKALKELYKEDTGIDFDVEFAQSKQDFTNEMGRGKQITTNRPTVKPIVEPTTPQPLVKPLLEIAQEPTLIPKVEQQPAVAQPVIPKVSPEIQKLDADFKSEVDRIKSNINKGTTNREMGQKRIKQLGFEHAAEKRRLIQGDSFEPVQGGLTAKELSDKIKKEQTNYVGKSVVTPIGEGKVIGQSFGKVGVEFEDGSKIYFVADEVEAKFDPTKPKVETQEPVITPKVEQPTQQTVKPLLQSTEQPTPKVIEQVDQSIEPTQTTYTGQPKASQMETPKVGESTARVYESALKSPRIEEDVKVKLSSLEEIFTLPTTTDKARESLAKQFVENNFEEATNMFKGDRKFNSSVDTFIMDEVIRGLQQNGRADEVVDVLMNASKNARNSGQIVQSFKILSRATPEGVMANAIKQFEKSQKPVDKEFVKEIGERVKNIKESNKEETIGIITGQVKGKYEKKILQKNLQGDDFDRLQAIAMQQVFGDLIEKTRTASELAGRQFSTAQAISHLLNATTTVRNISGNLSSISTEGASKPMATMFDNGIGFFTKERKVGKGSPFSVKLEEAKKRGVNAYNEILAGTYSIQADKDGNIKVGQAFNPKSSDEPMTQMQRFVTNPLIKVGSTLEKGLGIALNVPDEFFKGYVQADSMYSQLSARTGKDVSKLKLDEVKSLLTDSETERSIKEAEFATFQNDSLPSEILSELKQTLNRVGIGQRPTTSGRLRDKAFGVKQFGLGDLVIKYAKTPGNILARTVELSPAGYIKAIGTLVKFKDNPNFQRDFSQQIGRAMTGTGLTASGAFLRSNGVIVGEDDNMTPSERALYGSENISGYKINISALMRLASGKDTKIQEGDELKTFTWLGPVGLTLASGAAVHDALSEGATGMDVVKIPTAKAFDEFTDMPMLYTLNKMGNELMKKEDPEGTTINSKFVNVATIPVSEALPGFVLSPIRQIAQTVDPVIRDTKGKDIAETTKLKIMANIPVLSKKLQPKISPTGKELVRESVVPLDPFSTTTYKPTGYTSKLTELKKKTGQTTHFPTSISPNSFNNKGTIIELTPKEKTLYMKTIGNYVNEKYTALLSNVNIDSLTDAQAKRLSDRLSEIKSDASKKAKLEILKQRK